MFSTMNIIKSTTKRKIKYPSSRQANVWGCLFLKENLTNAKASHGTLNNSSFVQVIVNKLRRRRAFQILALLSLADFQLTNV